MKLRERIKKNIPSSVLVCFYHLHYFSLRRSHSKVKMSLNINRVFRPKEKTASGEVI